MKKLANHSALLFTLVASLWLTTSRAQNTFQLTAKEAVDLALKNVYAVKNARLNYNRQEAQNKEITGQALPQATGLVTVNKFFSIPVTSIPDFISPSVYSVLEQNNVQDGSGAPIKSPGNFGIFPAKFGVPWTGAAGFNISQLLFQPDVFVGLQARETALEFAKNNVAMVEDSVKANVYNAYYAVLIAQKQIVFTNESIARLEKLLHDQEIMYKNGFVEKLEVNRTQVSLTNLRTMENRLQNLSKMGKAALKLTMGISQNDSLLLKDTLSTEVISAGLLDNSGFKYEDRSEIRLLTTASHLQELNVKRHRMGYLPTVAAFWNYSYNAQRLKFDFFNTGKEWFPTSILGFRVDVPIFDGFQKKHKIRQARIEVERTGNDLANLKNVVDFQQESARIQLSNAIETLNLQQNNIELAQNVFTISRKKFEGGIGSNFELLQAESELQTAQANYFQALYDATVARTSYLRSLGRL